MWACWVPGGLGAAAIPSGLTTESYIFTGTTTGPPKPPDPPKDFEIGYETPYASSVKFIVSFNATFNVSKVSHETSPKGTGTFSFSIKDIYNKKNVYKIFIWFRTKRDIVYMCNNFGGTFFLRRS